MTWSMVIVVFAGPGWLSSAANFARSNHDMPYMVKRVGLDFHEVHTYSVQRSLRRPLCIDEVGSVDIPAASCSCSYPAWFRCARSWRRSTEFLSDDDGKKLDICTPAFIASRAKHARCGDWVCGQRCMCRSPRTGGMLRGRWILPMRTLAKGRTACKLVQ